MLCKCSLPSPHPSQWCHALSEHGLHLKLLHPKDLRTSVSDHKLDRSNLSVLSLPSPFCPSLLVFVLLTGSILASCPSATSQYSGSLLEVNRLISFFLFLKLQPPNTYHSELSPGLAPTPLLHLWGTPQLVYHIGTTPSSPFLRSEPTCASHQAHYYKPTS